MHASRQADYRQPRLKPRRTGARCAVVLVAALFVSAGLPAGAADTGRLPKSVERILDRFDLDHNGLSIHVSRVGSGEVLLDYQGGVPRNPASTIKLLTTFAALDTLTPAYTWETEVYAAGELGEDGTLRGDLLLRGGGDPGLVAESLWQMLSELRRRGIRVVDGDLVLDDSRFSLPEHDPGAFDGQPLRAYNVAPDALLVNFKVVQLFFERDVEHQRVRVSTIPALPNLEIRNEIELVPGRCRGYQRGIEIDAQPNGDAIRLRGQFPSGCRRYSLGRSFLNHDAYAYGLIAQQWRQLGGTLTGGYRSEPVPEDAEPLMTWPSKPFGDLIRLINKFSNNVMTRQVFLTLGAHYFGEPASSDKARAAITQWLREKGLDFTGFQIDNGSGLSREARIAPRDMAALLQLAWHSPYMPEFLSSMSLIGLDGTSRKRHRKSAMSGRAHVKTGRLDDVTAMAGYVLAKDGRRYVMVVMQNGKGVHRGGGEAVQDALLKWVYHLSPGSGGSSGSDRITTAE